MSHGRNQLPSAVVKLWLPKKTPLSQKGPFQSSDQIQGCNWACKIAFAYFFVLYIFGQSSILHTPSMKIDQFIIMENFNSWPVVLYKVETELRYVEWQLTAFLTIISKSMQQQRLLFHHYAAWLHLIVFKAKPAVCLKYWVCVPGILWRSAQGHQIML